MKIFVLLAVFLHLIAGAQSPVVRVRAGSLQGVPEDGVNVFKGVPYAQPPVGPLRWREPQAVLPWRGVRKADHFGARAMQRPIYKDMRFRSATISEDCLYLNIWTSSLTPKSPMPVLVYFHGGGLSAGDGSEWRYDGASTARQGVVMVTINYRLGVFGFLALEELSRESSHHSSGNYGLFDQRAALLWVKENIDRFGGDPAQVTIAGQSAGSVSVSAHMASPLSSGLFRRAIGESGSMLGSLPPLTLQKGEANGAAFCALAGVHSLKELRAVPAEWLLQLTADLASPSFPPVLDGYFLTATPRAIFAAGQQANVPLLAGWTSAEVNYHYLMREDSLSAEAFRSRVEKLYGARAVEILEQYPYSDEEQLLQSATDLASDRFIVYGTWKWLDLHAKTNHSVYRYLFAQKLPPLASGVSDEPLIGAPHSADIEYALGNLALDPVYQWTDTDKEVSRLMHAYFINFIKTSDPNGATLPAWPALQNGLSKIMVFSTDTKAEEEKHAKRYIFLDSFYVQ